MLRRLLSREDPDPLAPAAMRTDTWAPALIVVFALAVKMCADQLAARHQLLCEQLAAARRREAELCAEIAALRDEAGPVLPVPDPDQG